MRTLPFVVIGTSLVVSPMVLAGPVQLTDQQLERVAAGSTDYSAGHAARSSGGAIVGNSSSAAIATSGNVAVDDGVQQGARAVNLVNSAESGIANGVNVWDGRVESQGASTPVDTQQANSIIQDQAHAASLPNYVRTDANIDQTRTESSETSHSGSVDTMQKVLGQEVKAGMGVSIAGQLDANLTGGSISLANKISGEFKGGFDATGPLGISGADSSTDITAKTEQTLDWVLPDLTLSVKGAGCYVEIGTCDSNGTYKSASSETTNTRSPFTLQDAKAEYIVVDGSTLDATNNYSVTLSGSAQSQAQAVNLANAAGSAIANAVNVSRTPTAGTNLNLSQVNTIVQRR